MSQLYIKQVLKGCNGRYLTFNSDGTIGCTLEEIKDNTKVIMRTRGDKVWNFPELFRFPLYFFSVFYPFTQKSYHVISTLQSVVSRHTQIPNFKTMRDNVIL